MRVFRRHSLGLLLACLLLDGASGSEASEQGELKGFYRGKLGALPVDVSLESSSGKVEGTYFYRKNGADIPLSGALRPDGSFTLEEHDPSGHVTGKWEGRLQANGKLGGSWTAPGKPRTLSFDLERRKPSRLEHPENAVLPPRPGQPENAEVVHDSFGWRRAQVPGTLMQFPRITHLPDPALVETINKRLDELTQEFGCRDENDRLLADDSYSVSSDVHYAGQDILSIYISVTYLCAGAASGADEWNRSLTFDLREHGKEVLFADLFKDYQGQKSDILSTIFAEQLERNKRLVTSGAKGDDGDCATTTDLWVLESLTNQEELGFSFSTRGLEVQSNFEGYAQACNELVTVPYAQLTKFARPGGLLERVLVNAGH
jgi:hypothetical protein